MLTNKQIEEIKARRSKATYTPWLLERDIMGSELDICGTPTPESGNPVIMAVILGDDEDGNTDEEVDNGKFIAKAPEDIDSLIAEVERLAQFQELAPLVFEEVYRDHPGAARDCTTCFGRYVAFRDSWFFTRPGHNRPEVELPATSIEHAEQLCWEHHQNCVKTNLFVQRPTA